MVAAIDVILLINACIYAQIWRVARKQRRQIGQVHPQQTTGRDKATVTVVMIVVAYAILWAPYTLSAMIALFTGNFQFLVSQEINLLFIIGCSNSILNCIVYVALTKKFRRAITSDLTCCRSVPTTEWLNKLVWWPSHVSLHVCLHVYQDNYPLCELYTCTLCLCVFASSYILKINGE